MSTSSRRLGKYELREPLGRGGMAEVWKAFDTQLHRYVAVKLLHADLQADPGFIERFMREAQTVAALRHPNIVQIYDFHIIEPPESESTMAYMVMEYIQGNTLADYLDTTSHRKLFPPNAEIIRLFTPIALALDYAHRQDTIHRDIKPANILLDQTNTTRNAMGEPILSDFGLAKLLGAASLTLSGTVAGTPLYISPEQLLNHPVSNRTDLYALGIVLYEVFTGAPPFLADSVSAIMMKHITDMPVELHLVNPQLPPALSKVMAKSLAKKPEDRYPTAAAMIVAMAEALNLPVPSELKASLSSPKLPDIVEEATAKTPVPTTPASNGTAPASQLPANAVPPIENTILVAKQAPETIPPTHKDKNPVSNPAGLSEAEVRSLMQAQTMRGVPANAASNSADDLVAPSAAVSTPASGMVSPVSLSSASPASPSVSAPPVVVAPPTPPRKRNGLRIALVALLIVVLLGAGLGAFFVFTRNGSTATSNTVVGQASFVSSGMLGLNSSVGLNDQFQIDLHNIPNPPAGKSYYAWLLPDNNQSENPDIRLGKLTVNNGNVHFLYQGDSQHTNLLAITSSFLITEESSNATPDIPSLDHTAWLYYASLPQTVPSGQTYSLLDHLRHLLAKDPELEALNLHGGLVIWAYRNTQRVTQLAHDAMQSWKAHDYASVKQDMIVILDYLDGQKEVQRDVPTGTPVVANQHNSQVGLLTFDTVNQKPPGYLYHIQLHLNGVVAAPGATTYQKNLAIQINSAVGNVNNLLLHHVRPDAVQLVHMDTAQLAQSSSLTLLNDIVTQSNVAFMGGSDVSTHPERGGLTQIYVDVQHLATFTVTSYQQGK